jgi:branched-chain amino acid transport system substrate-binding protein
MPTGAAAQDGQTLTIYSSLPLQGAQAHETRAAVRGIDLALEPAGGRVGGFTVRHVSLDDSTRRAASWTPEAEAQNARTAAENGSTIAYIGAWNSGATAVSLPILNEAGVGQVSPSNTAVGLTEAGPGADRGEPERYYPTGRRTYVRIAPNDVVHGAAMARAMKEARCRRAWFLDDGELYGAGIARAARAAARRIRLHVAGRSTIDPRALSYRALASTLRRRRTDCVGFGGITANGPVQLFSDLARAIPRVRLFGSEGIAESGFTDPREGGVPAAVGRRVRVVAGALPPAAYGAAGRRFFAEFRVRYGERLPDPYAIFGYEAASLVLDAIARAGQRGSERAAVVEALFATRDRDSVLGTYSIDGNGDTTLSNLALYRISRGALVFDRIVRP